MENQIKLLISEESAVFTAEEIGAFNSNGIDVSFCSKDGNFDGRMLPQGV